MNIISTDKAPAAVGPYSQAIEANGFIFCAGQIGLDPVTGLMKETLEEQSTQIFENIDAVLAEAGVDKNHVIKTTIFIKNIDDFSKVNDMYATYFGEHKPARSTVEVSNLPKGAVIEIEVIAVK